MIKQLKASVAFPINGVNLRVDVSFQPGVTAIVGRNGSGKTFTGSELPRYLLFGKKALRGMAADYKTLKASGCFTIAGKPYTIVRSASEEQITDGKGVILAVGAEAVTKKVEELFGYGLEIFDICNASTQKKADLFGQLRPAERKRKIDRVIGLTSNEAVEKLCRTEATGYKREAEALTRQLREPVKPQKPKGYRSSELLAKMLSEGRDSLRTQNEIKARIRPLPALETPRDPRVGHDEVLTLQKAQDEFSDNKRERARLQAVLDECVPYSKDDWTEEQLALAEARLAAKLEIERRGPEPFMEKAEIEKHLATWAEIAAIERLSRETVTCPKCDHKFLTGPTPPATPNYSMQDLREQQEAHADWAAGPVEIPEGPDLTRHEIDHARRAIAAKARYDEARAALDALPVLTDRQTELDEARTAYDAWRAYDLALAASEAQEKANAEAEEDLRVLGNVPTQDDLDALSDELSVARIYETGLARFEDEQTAFNNLSVQIAEKTKMAEEFTKGASALADARATVKSFLAPSLSRVASAIINDMTLGELSSVVVDDDMEITVNGQRLETLSGAGETVANIALRVALGQVLVGNTFPVFLGDEMDSNADEYRRAATAEAIRNLKGRLQQIILITHRTVEIADHVVDLNEGVAS